MSDREFRVGDRVLVSGVPATITSGPFFGVKLDPGYGKAWDPVKPSDMRHLQEDDVTGTPERQRLDRLARQAAFARE